MAMLTPQKPLRQIELPAPCKAARENFRGYGEGLLNEYELGELKAHLKGCPSCREQLQSFTKLYALMDNTLGKRHIGEDFTARAEKTLRDTPEQVDTKPAQRRKLIAAAPANLRNTDGYENVDEDFEEEAVAASQGGFLESLSAQFGAAPWWIISGAFHALLILLVFLIGMVVMQAKQNDVVIVTNLEKQEKPPEPEKKLERDVIERPVPVVQSEVVSDQQPIVTHEIVEFAEQVETDNDSDARDSKGEDGISDIWLGGQGTVGSLGVGGGGRAGAFGRPGGAGGRLQRAIAGGGGKATESAVDKALEWLARHQEADGHWDTVKYESKYKNDTAMTAFALLAFLGAGHTEKVGKYKDNVNRAVTWLVGKVQADGRIEFDTDKAHGHTIQGYVSAITGLSLAEAAAMARVPRTIEAAQKCVNYSVEIHQNGGGTSEGKGWRYKAKEPGDLSHVGWFTMQLKSAKVAGLHIPQGGFEGAAWFLDQTENKNFPAANGGDSSFDNGRHRYGYTTNAIGQITERPMRTAIGCLCRMFLGVPADEVRGGVDWFVATKGDRGGGLPDSARPNAYYWYYGTLCTFQCGGDAWKKWNEALKNALLPTQRKDGDFDGSWDPEKTEGGGAPWGQMYGRVGQTALNALCLEVYYRYLPMYR